MQLSFNSPISQLPGIGPNYQSKLFQLGINTVKDLLYYFPFRYEDLSSQKKIAELSPGETVTITATLWSITKIRSKAGKNLIKAVVNDTSGALDVIWFNQTYLLSVLKTNQKLNLSGKIGFFGSKLSLINPKYELIKETGEQIHTARLVPIYSESARVSAKWLRSKIYQLLNSSFLEIAELLPEKLLVEEKLPVRAAALKRIHFPNNLSEAEEARSRFAFEELFLLHLRNLSQSKRTETAVEQVWKVSDQLILEFKKLLPFELTDSQLSAIKDLKTDLEKGEPMNRLLQGEVGSGKTVVAAFAIFAGLTNGLQAAFMAPTEILSFQHYETLKKVFEPNFKVALSTGSKKLDLDNFDIVVGTQALLNQSLSFKNLGLIVVDEQQRFGVAQRSLLREKGKSAHFLTMTATPIPRTLALTIYGQLQISVLNELPSGRKKVKTFLVPNEKRLASYEFIRKEVKENNQVFILCPLISESESLLSVKSATEEYEFLRKEIYPNFKIGLLHGALSSKDKSKVVEDFRNKKIEILVTTPVVEVGIDIPNATIMVIEAAERFGLASLHQLRGRVGRGAKQAYCFLFTEQSSEQVTDRLKLLESHNNGLELAELDLKLRGAGDIFGTFQSGQIPLKTFAFINLDLITRSRVQAEKLASDELFELLKEEIGGNEADYSVSAKD
ncbi:MAG TPA: ATP-dependent DNA helicase RecG [Candidatus Saccharimonadales bacterium]|nr:ATP-dependent DNA helicase RecG [Candidatus Saccharimonadales bacterium]